jgi:fatty-acyl-CoA synthase
VRSAEGFCIRCADDEPGEAIGKLPHTSSLAGQFEGYTDPAASDRKILRDVFASGDAWYRAGDLMRRDHGGFFYFVDRLGDTFRCKGENVSTTEIEEVVAAYPGVVEAVVYGVAVPGVDGRVGMAAIVARPEFELTGFATHLAERLPDYARPLFLRLCSEIVITGTFKPQKQALARAGYDLTAVTDALFVYDRRLDVFKPLDAELYQRIERGELRP